MIKKILYEDQKKLIIGLSILSFIVIFWYAITLITAGVLMTQSAAINNPFSLFNYKYIILFNFAHSLLDVQYLTQVNFSGYVAVFCMIIGGFSLIEILYMLLLFTLASFYIFDKNNQEICRFILLFHLVILFIFMVCAAYFGKLAFDVFYHVNTDLEIALKIASRISIVVGSMILFGSSWVFYRFYNSQIHHKKI